MIKTSRTIKVSPSSSSLEQLEVDTDKDWAAKRIYNLAEISIGDIVFSNNWRLTEIDNGIVLLDNENKEIGRWTNE